ncbi:FAD-binding oxidoreductase [Tropicimonas sp.]|uniref:FAD-binding oxidoreductase n=1 Tax=Tropicimonas sp. TaxID=2067044 RepID=UPI003A8879F5
MLNPVTDEMEAALRAQVPAAAFRPLAPHYLEEPRGRFRGCDALLVAPATVEEVAAVVRAANAFGAGVIPFGGGTGLVGGQISEALPRPVLLSLERMRRVRAVYREENVLVAEAGVVLADVQQAARDAERMFPLSLASEGSAQIGGLLSVNAGGVNVLRYGNARELCLGLEAVLPDGSVLRGLKRLRKDNTGYDLRNLLIGAEGTLGVITAASLRLYPRPWIRGAAFMVVESPAAALRLLEMAQRRMGEGVSAFELIGGTGLDFLAGTMPEIRQPFVPHPDWVVLIGLGLSGERQPSDELEGLFAEAAEAGLVQDGVIARSEAQRLAFWHLRESIPEANRRIGAVASHDISVPISAIPDFIVKAGEALARLGDFRINCFGHLGDGNLHYNLFPAAGRGRRDYDPLRAAASRAVYDLVDEFDGSISAEHGIGRLKVAELERYGDPARLAAMRAIKAALDPQGIMNPGAVLGLTA